MVGSHGNLCHINVAVSGGNHTQVFLAHTLAGSGELGDGAERGCLGRLAACVGVYFRVEYEDVHIFAGRNHVVQATVADVVGSAVATDDPLAAFYQIVGQFGQFCAVRATSSLSGFDEREQLAGGSLAGIGIVHAVNPFLSSSLEVGRRAFGSDGFFQDGFDAGTHLLVGQGHTHAVFAEVLEQGVRPSRTLSLFVRRIRRGRN